MLTRQRCATGKLNALFNAELLAFHSNFDVAPVPMEQELRAGVIAWIATFAPEAISPEGEEQLWEIFYSIRKRSDFRSFGWYRTPYLDVARFSLSGDHDALSIIINNIDHHNSSLRSALHPPLGLVAAELSLDDYELSSRMEHCLESGLFFNDSLMCILSVLRDDPQRKIELVKKWRREIDLVPQDAKMLDCVFRGDGISNSLIMDELFLILRYLFCRLLDPELSDIYTEKQLDLFPHWKHHLIWKRMCEHPLLKATIYFRRESE